MVERPASAGVVTCTLTLVDDYNGEYDDDLQHQRSEGKEKHGALGRSQITRLVVGLLDRWVDNYHENCRRDELAILGRALYAIAFGDESSHPDFPLRTAFESTVRQCAIRGMRLRLRLALGPNVKDLAEYPWEFMYLQLPEQEGGYFLAGQNTSLSLTRFIPNTSMWVERNEFDAERLRILVVVSTPPIPGMTELTVGSFVDNLKGLNEDGADDAGRDRPERFDIRTMPSPTQTELREEISDYKPHVIHFIGHGRPGALALRKDDETLQRERDEYEARRDLGQRPQTVSEAVWINEKTASDVLRTGLEEEGTPPRLIFLHACEGARAEQTKANLDGFSSVARELVRSDRISGVIAMQYTIQVKDAELFATAFYQRIAKGDPLDDAMTQARKKLATTPRPSHEESWDDPLFGTPVIYLRSERALVSRRPPRRSRQEAAEKEPCPNGLCPGYILRTQQPQHCKVCREPFAVCPKCNGVVVPKPGWECRDCDYAFSDPVPDAPSPGQRTPAEIPGAGPRAGLQPASSAPERSLKPQPSSASQDAARDELQSSDFDPTGVYSGGARLPPRTDHSGPDFATDSLGPPDDEGPEGQVQWS